jgi:hypothetical protein
MKRVSCLAVIGLVLTAVGGCSRGGDDVHVVDLNRVLDIFVTVLEKQVPGGDAAKVEVKKPAEKDADAKKDGKAAPPANNVVEVKDDKAKTDAFLAEFTKELNAANLITAPIGTTIAPSGAIEGFVDMNSDMTMSGAGEEKLFTIEIDQERQRVIASDANNEYHRDHHYRYRPGGGFFMGYMLGNMFNRQNSFYSGSNAASKPQFGSRQMSPQNYHSSAVSKAKAARASVRAKGGSGGFRFGK